MNEELKACKEKINKLIGSGFDPMKDGVRIYLMNKTGMNTRLGKYTLNYVDIPTYNYISYRYVFEFNGGKTKVDEVLASVSIHQLFSIDSGIGKFIDLSKFYSIWTAKEKLQYFLFTTMS